MYRVITLPFCDQVWLPLAEATLAKVKPVSAASVITTSYPVIEVSPLIEANWPIPCTENSSESRLDNVVVSPFK